MQRVRMTCRLILFVFGVIVLAGAVVGQSGMTQQLLEAAKAGDADGVRSALDAGAEVNSRDSSKRTALLLATIADSPQTAKLLIDAGANVNAKDDRNDSPFLYAGAQGRTEILKLLLAAGADLSSTNRFGGTALIPACHHGHVETVKVLLETSIDIDHVNRLGWTALMETVILGDGGPTYQEIAQLLLDAGADPNIADHDGVTPLAHARRHGYIGIAQVLEAAGGK